MSGYVRIHRSVLGHPVFRNDAEAMAFAWMVVRAAWKPATVRYKDHVIHLQRGELAVSVRDMAAAMDRDKAWVERLWKRLKNETMVETRSETGVSVVTICNYSEYQAERDIGKTPDDTEARQGQDTEQRKGINKEEKKALAPLPDWLPQKSWEEFVAMRKDIKKPITDRGIKRAVADLLKLKEGGEDVEAVIQQTVRNEWRGFFPVKKANGYAAARAEWCPPC